MLDTVPAHFLYFTVQHQSAPEAELIDDVA